MRWLGFNVVHLPMLATRNFPIKQRVITVAGRMYSVLPFRQLRRLASMRIVIERFAKEPSEDYGFSESMPVLENMD